LSRERVCDIYPVVGISELVKDKEAIFLTEVEKSILLTPGFLCAEV